MTRPVQIDDDWEARPGMVKRQCAHCGHFFASTGASSCANCIAKRRVPADSQQASQIPARTKRHVK